MANGKTLVQRIALDGGEEIRQALLALGAAGAEAFGALKAASADVAKAGAGMNKVLGDTEKAFADIRKSAAGLGPIITRVGGAIAAAFSVRVLVNATNVWTDLTGRVKLAIAEHENAAEVLERLRQAANRTYSDLENTAEVFLRFNSVLRELNFTTAEQLDIVEAVNNALVVSGAKGDRARTVSEALARAFAAGALRGQELNTVMEQGGRIAQLLADHFGVSRNALRELGAAGRITAQEMAEAFRSQGATVGAEADAMAATIADAFTRMRNNFLAYIGQADQVSGVSAAIASAILLIADNLNIVIPLVAAFGVAWAAVRIVAIVSAFGELIASVGRLGKLLLANPITLWIAGITTAALAVLYLTGQLDGFVEALQRAGGELIGWATQSREAAAAAEDFGGRAGEAMFGVAEATREVAAAGAEAAAEIGAASETASAELGGIRAAAGEATVALAGTGQEIAGVGNAAGDAAQGVGDDFSEATATASEGFAGLAARAIESLRQITSEARRAASAVAGIGSGAGADDSGFSAGGPVGFAGGGRVRGPGTSTSDSILARLSRGEFVVRTKAVRHYGADFFAALNSMRVSLDSLRGLRGFALGGLVDQIGSAFAGLAPRPTGLPALASGAAVSAGRPVNLTLGGETFALLAPSDVAERLVRYAAQSNLVSAGRKPGWYGG